MKSVNKKNRPPTGKTITRTNLSFHLPFLLELFTNEQHKAFCQGTEEEATQAILESQHCNSSPACLSMPLIQSYDNTISISKVTYIRTCLATSLTKATPGSNVANTTEPYLRTSGTGLIRIVTSVITPKVPGGRKPYICNKTTAKVFRHSHNT